MSKTYTLRLVTNGSGAASDQVNFDFNNRYRRLLRVKTDFEATGGAGSILTVTDGDGVQVLATPAGNTDRTDHPSVAVVNAAGAAVTNGQTPPLVRGPLTVAVSAGGSGKVVGVQLVLE